MTKIHGMSKTPIHNIWGSMKQRCTNPNDKRWKDYGGRGIKLCDRWYNFANFYEDMWAEYQNGLTLERIDVNGDYCPENCRWITKKEQSRNRRNTMILLVARGEKMNVPDASEQFNIPKATLRNRARQGLTGEALVRPIVKGRRRDNHFIDTKKWGKITIAEAASKSGIDAKTLRQRVKAGDTGDYLFRPIMAGRNKNNHFIDTPWGKITIPEASKLSGINEITLRSRVKKGDTGEYLFRPVDKTRSTNNVYINTTKWGLVSLSEASRLSGISMGALRWRLSQGYTGEDLFRENISQSYKHSSRSTKHGMHKSRIYRIWSGMKQRCTNPNSPSYKNHGARGIKVCDRWQTFENFYADMKDGYADNLTLDRIDNNSDYCPENCRWVTYKEQAINKRNTVVLNTPSGNMNVHEATKLFGVNDSTLRDRARQGLTGEDLVRPIVKGRRKDNHFIDTEKWGRITLAEAARRSGISDRILQYRIKQGETGENLFRKPDTKPHFIDTKWGRITVTEASKLSEISLSTLLERLKAGDIGEYLFRPVVKGKNKNNVYIITPKGEMTITEASKVYKINKGTLQTRIKAGDTGERLFRPVRKKVCDK